MPKSAKKRREKAVDFTKAKLKLGKGKQTANNVVDTSFKARSIALPTQSIAVQKDNTAPTTRRKLTFQDLISLVKHYNPGTRKDAILGLRELLESHPELVQSSLTPLLNACVRIISDEDASVRTILLNFFTWLLPRIPSDDLIPHSPSLLLFTTSAQTHIFPEIRIDAIRFLNLFLEYIPEMVVVGWAEGRGAHGSRVLEGYLGILNAGTAFGETDGPMKATSTASVVLTAVSKLLVLQSLSMFLRYALSSHSPPAGTSTQSSAPTFPNWYLASSFKSQDGFEAYDQLFQPSYSQTSRPSRLWQEEVELESGDDEFIQNYPLASSLSDNHWTLEHLSDVANNTGTITQNVSSRVTPMAFITHLARTLHSVLLSTFLDCAPAVFSPGSNPPISEVKLVVVVGEILRSLYTVILQNSSSSDHCDTAFEELKTILGYMAAYFPFTLSGNRDIEVEQSFQDLNLVFCELTSLLVLAIGSTPPSRTKRRGKIQPALHGSAVRESLAIRFERVSIYVAQLLNGEAVSTSQLGRSLTSAAYTALLPTIWSLLNHPTASHNETTESVLQSSVLHATKTSSKSASKKPTVEFLARVLLLETDVQYQGTFKIGRTLNEGKAFKEWINHLPKVLWELGATNLPLTEVILRFLLRLLQRKSVLVNAETITSLRSRLVPYFSITHAVRGQVTGPYDKLPTPALRRLALDVAITLMASREAGQHDDGLGNAVDQAVVNTREISYWANSRMSFLSS